jgi:hypothetical protein
VEREGEAAERLEAARQHLHPRGLRARPSLLGPAFWAGRHINYRLHF